MISVPPPPKVTSQKEARLHIRFTFASVYTHHCRGARIQIGALFFLFHSASSIYTGSDDDDTAGRKSRRPRTVAGLLLCRVYIVDLLRFYGEADYIYTIYLYVDRGGSRDAVDNMRFRIINGRFGSTAGLYWSQFIDLSSFSIVLHGQPMYFFFVCIIRNKYLLCMSERILMRLLCVHKRFIE